MDAGVASVLAATVTEQSRVGLGGEIPLLIQINGKAPVAISGIGVAPEKATVEFYKTRPAESWEEDRNPPPIPAQGIRAAITPGLFDGLILALSNYGTKSFSEVAAPAIEYADGFPIGEEYAGFIRGYQRFLNLWPASKAFFLPGGQPPARGDVFRSTDLAKTLRQLAAAEKKARGKRQAKLRACARSLLQRLDREEGGGVQRAERRTDRLRGPGRIRGEN